MPDISEIQKGRAIGIKSSNKFIWAACETCGRQRWVRLQNGQARCNRCSPCAGKAHSIYMTALNQRGMNHPCWKGGTRVRKEGYVMVHLEPNDFFYPMVSDRYVLEHRLVMAKSIGRCLHDWEIVHHLNGNKADNRIENLSLTMVAYHNTHTLAKASQERVKNLEVANIQLRRQLKDLQGRVTFIEAENALLRTTSKEEENALSNVR